MAEYTPPPWEWDYEEGWLVAPDPDFPGDDEMEFGIIILGLDHRDLHELWPEPGNAALIKAAPDLLAACESDGNSGGRHEDGPELLEFAASILGATFDETATFLRLKAQQERAAIAKARKA